MRVFSLFQALEIVGVESFCAFENVCVETRFFVWNFRMKSPSAFENACVKVPLSLDIFV
jgi:hypothetical protein